MTEKEDVRVLSTSEIKSFLETSALYSWRTFGVPEVGFSSLSINEIDSFCTNCNCSRPFQDLRARGGAGTVGTGLKTGMSYFHFSCVSCRRSARVFWVEQIVLKDTIKIQKFGELPRSSLPRDRVLQKFLKHDLENYEKAVVCLAQEYGIAAFAYFRRVVESNVLMLLDLVREDAQSSGADETMLSAIEKLRDASPMSEKIKVANLALPAHLQPDGLNPLGRIYQALSDGVHSLSDRECLTKAKAISDCLTFLVSELATTKERRLRFKSSIGAL
jgi:hypothetical protein